MKTGGVGGGNTITGLIFEGNTDLLTFLSKQNGYSIKGNIIFFHNKEVARTYKKHAFYKFLQENKIDWKNIISKKLLTDDSI